jgi:UDP-N-acetyl-D-glucosamine dehydrogenase
MIVSDPTSTGRAGVKTVIVGQGYVGLPIAMLAVKAGHDVVGLESSPQRASRLVNAASYVDDVSDAELSAALASGRYLPTSDTTACANFEVAVITVPTPLREGVPDLSFIEEAARTLAPHLTIGATVVLESTTYPGTTTDLLTPLLQDGSGLKAGIDFFVGYSPERIDPGNPVWRLDNTPKIVSGIEPDSLAAVRDFYQTLVENVVEVSSPGVAELAKLLENTFRHVNIALVNELMMFASDLQVDVWEAIDAASTKPFGFMPFRPGPGVGGHCLPVDPSYLSWQVKQSLGFPFRFIELANDVNDHMPDYVVRRAAATLNRDRMPLNGSRILVLGLAYKPNSGDSREAPGPVICRRLAASGADVRAADPHVPEAFFPASLLRREATIGEIQKADLVIVVTDHDAFDWIGVKSHSKRVLDTRHRLPAGANIEYL